MNVIAKISSSVREEKRAPKSHDRWRRLYRGQMRVLKDHLCPEFLNGIRSLRITEDHIPSFADINAILTPSTGWKVLPVTGAIDGRTLFESLARRHYLAYLSIRGEEEMEFAQAPDIFHDFFGHVPMLMNPAYGNFLQAFGRAGVKTTSPAQRQELLSLYFCTAETGLVKTSEGIAFYGAACLSSRREAEHCLNGLGVEHLPFSLKAAKRTHIDDKELQQRYFVIESFDQLYRIFA